jgi:hypothetical protein
MILCILKSVVAYVILMFVGTNLLGFLVRGFWELLPSIDAPPKRLAEIFARETRRMRIGNFVTKFFFFLLTFAYLIALFYFFEIGVVLAACLVMASRLPDLLWEIRTGAGVTRQNAPRGVPYTVAGILGWVALPLLWYSLCMQP